LFETQRSSLM